MKNFIERHPLMVGSSLTFIFCVLGGVLGERYSSYYFLIWILAFVSILGVFLFMQNWQWVCTKCGREGFSTRNKYCSQCGGIMGLVKKGKKFCPNGHYVEEWDKFCPKCSARL